MNRFLPIAGLIRREMLMALRRKSNMFWLVVLLLCFVLMIAANWPSNDRLFLGRGGYVSRDILIYSCLMLMVGAALVMPGLGAAAIPSERDMDTHDQLRLTLLGDTGLILGNLVNNLGLYFLFVLGVAPAIAAAFFLTGVETSQLAVILVCLVCTAVCCCLGGMGAWAAFQRTITGHLVAYVLMLLYMGLPLLFLALLLVASSNQRVGKVVEYVMRVYRLVAVTVSGGNATSTGLAGFLTTVLPVTTYSLATSMCFFGVTWVALRRRHAEGLSQSRRALVVEPALFHQSARAVPKLSQYVDDMRFPDFVNPVYLREKEHAARTGWAFTSKAILAGLVFSAGNILVAAFIQEVDSDEATTIQLVLAVDMAGAALFLPATVMGIFASDFERDRADMLRLTLLTPEAIGTGKVWQAFENAAPMVLGIVCSTVVPLVLVTDWQALAS